MDNEDLTRQLTRLTHTVTELLLWVQEAESKEVLPPGTLREAHRAAERGRVVSRIKTMRETLDMIDQADDLTSLRVSLKDSLEQLEGRVASMGGRHGKT